MRMALQATPLLPMVAAAVLTRASNGSGECAQIPRRCHGHGSTDEFAVGGNVRGDHGCAMGQGLDYRQ